MKNRVHLSLPRMRRFGRTTGAKPSTDIRPRRPFFFRCNKRKEYSIYDDFYAELEDTLQIQFADPTSAGQGGDITAISTFEEEESTASTTMESYPVRSGSDADFGSVYSTSEVGVEEETGLCGLLTLLDPCILQEKSVL